MDISTLHLYSEVAEELYSAGQPLHAFATLHALLTPPVVIPFYYRREEIYCRIRAAEMLLCSSLPSPRSGRKYKNDGTASSAAAACLDMAHSVLSPMVSSRRYLENAVICPLLWVGNHINSGEGIDAAWEEKNEETDSDNRMVPVALVVKAYALSAVVHRRRLRWAQAVRCCEAAQEWCDSVFRNTLAGLSIKTNDAEDEENSVMEAQEEEEKRCCEALLSVELCQLYYSQLMSFKGTATTAQQMSVTANSNNTITRILDRLLFHAKNYAGYVTATNVDQHRQYAEGRRKRNSICLSAPENSFSIRAAGRVLGHYYCVALIFNHRAVEAERHMQQCEVLFGISPELRCMMCLFVAGQRGPLAATLLSWKDSKGVKRQREEEEEEEEKEDTCVYQTVKHTTEILLHGNLRWLSDGLLGAVRTYMALYFAANNVTVEDVPVATSLTSSLITNSPDKLPRESDNSDTYCYTTTTSSTTSNSSKNKNSTNNPVQELFYKTLCCIDEQLTLLTTTDIHVDRSSNACLGLLCSSPSDIICFLVLLKCAAFVTMSTYALSQLWLTEGVRRLLQLRRYMAVFYKHTTSLQVHYHLLASQLSLMLSLRHLPGVDGVEKTTEENKYGGFNKNNEGESTAGFDVGIPYAHLRAAETAALYSTTSFCSPSILLLITLMKGAALSHTSRVGSSFQLGDTELTLMSLTVHQRHRCAVALINVLESLGESFDAAFMKEDVEETTEKEKEKRKGRQKLKSAWNVANHIFLQRLRGVAAMSEEKDEFTAMCTFKDALQLSKQHFGSISCVTAECLYLLAIAYKEYERVPLELSTISSHTECGNKDLLCTIANERTDNAQQIFLAAWQLASQASRLTKLHFALAAQGGNLQEDCRRIIDEWGMEIQRVCLTMRRELREVLSL